MDLPTQKYSNESTKELHLSILNAEINDTVDLIVNYYSENHSIDFSIRGDKSYTDLIDHLSVLMSLTSLCNAGSDSVLTRVFNNNFNDRNKITYAELSEQVNNALQMNM